ncbi:MAG: tRNA pseudouridine38-40 synthase [Betaproteobacteria bacterium]
MTRVRVALGVEYDGAAFCGWQTQLSGCGVQDHLQRALSCIAGEPVDTICAGRTDAGVHALAQVVHFDTSAKRPESAWVRGVNAALPSAVAVVWAREVDEAFHARFSARRRCYRYVLLNDMVRPAAAHGRVGWFHLPLDLDVMQRAAQLLLGEHDFSAFRSSECQASSPVRTLEQIDIERRGVYVVFDFCANGFLHHMVRNLVGTLIYVGKGKHVPEWVREVLVRRQRSLAAPTFEAAGLYLARVEYDSDWSLPTFSRSLGAPLLELVRP